MNNSVFVSPSLQQAYDEQYDDSILEWRMLGGKYKAENIMKVCGGKSFNKVLDCGAGEGSVMFHLQKSDFAKEMYAIDISDSALRQIHRRNIHGLTVAVKFDGYHIPYADGFFDVVYCSHVIEHVEHPRILLRELKRVSKQVIFEIPLDYSVKADRAINHFLSYGHINIFTPTTFRFLLKSEGFTIKSEYYGIITDDVLRYNWYINMKKPKTFRREFSLLTRKLRFLWRRVWMSKQDYQEYSFTTYTCLSEVVD